MKLERRVVRCAIYTRKSSEEGLEQDFNSLDAQFEACAAYVTSQKHEGWKLLPVRFDDGGFSGGTLERPGLKRLLAQIEAGKIDMVVVYKIDRLTRSLLDFGKLVELLDKVLCSFVSVTQSFNTLTSMGRLTLNMLLSFAQFEREVTGERIRDKIAASKKKGMWMGGVPPLGYQAKERQLILEGKEAAVVRHIFDLYREHRCIVRTKRAADQLCLRGRPSAKYPEGPSFTRGGVYWLLTNPIYAGRVRHKDQTYPGQHEPLIEPPAWDEIQAILISQLGGRARGPRNACHPSPLAGRIVDEIGERLTPSHAASSGGRRRYYVSKNLIEKNDEQASSGWRLPAVHVEQTVVSIVMDHLGTAGAATRATEGRSIVKVISDLDRRLKVLATTFSPAAALALVEQVQIAQGQIGVKLGRLPIANALNLSPEMVAPAFLHCSRAFQMRRRGVETQLLVGDDPVMLDPALLKFVARAYVWWEQVRGGSTLGAIAKREGVTKRLIGLHLPAAFLAPDILQLIVDGRQPGTLTAQALRTQLIPAVWDDQRSMFGIANPIEKVRITIAAQ